MDAITRTHILEYLNFFKTSIEVRGTYDIISEQVEWIARIPELNIRNTLGTITPAESIGSTYADAVDNLYRMIVNGGQLVKFVKNTTSQIVYQIN